MSEEFQERNQQATPKKRREARERGEVVLSPDAATAVVFVCAGWAMTGLGPGAVAIAGEHIEGCLRALPGVTGPAEDIVAAAANVSLAGFAAVLLVSLAVLLVSAAPSFVQTGFNFTLTPVVPDWSRLDAFSRLRQVFFSADAFGNVVRETLKVAVVGVAAWFSLRGATREAADLTGADAHRFLALVLSRGGGLFVTSGTALAAVAALDYLWRWRRMETKLRMTTEELKRERKEEDGDPLLRGRLRSRWREMTLNRILKEVPRADVVVVNPTHYAVALRYASGESSAPRVTAKGKDMVAARIREVARRHGVPILEEPPLARALYSGVRVGREVPVTLYKAVARVLARVYAMRRRSGVGAA